MTEFKGTIGKWEFDDHEVYTDEKGVLGNLICYAPDDFPTSYENWKENAQLISKAPEMLEMLEKMSQYLIENRSKNYAIELMAREFFDKNELLIKEATTI